MSLYLTTKIVFSLTLNGKQLPILQNITVYMRMPFRCAILYTSNLTQRKGIRIYTPGSADYHWELCVHDRSQFMFGSGDSNTQNPKTQNQNPKTGFRKFEGLGFGI
jgi:hypothetical protein